MCQSSKSVHVNSRHSDSLRRCVCVLFVHSYVFMCVVLHTSGIVSWRECSIIGPVSYLTAEKVFDI